MEERPGYTSEIDIGHGVRVQFFVGRDGKTPIGLTENHAAVNGAGVYGDGNCCGAVYFDVPEVHERFPGGAVWQVQSLDPLAISPSLLCRVCGHHGFIREGEWVPA